MNAQYLSNHLGTPNLRTIDRQQQEQEPTSSPKMIRREYYPQQQQQQQQQQHWLINSLASLLPNGIEYWSSLASLLGLLALVQGLINSILPPNLRLLLFQLFNRLFCKSYLSTYCYFEVDEYEGGKTNELYMDVHLYLSDSPSISSSSRVRLARIRNNSSSSTCSSSSPSPSPLTMAPATDEPLLDAFSGATAMWQHVVTQSQSNNGNYNISPDKRRFTLRMSKKDRGRILDSYLDHIMNRASEIRRKNKNLLLYTNNNSNPRYWESVTFKHPSTFETLAMDPIKKSEIMADLLCFADGGDFYEKTGRAWKRGYLLYGPPGTGKSSIIAAMANYLGYDIFDLELTEVQSNSMLRTLLMMTTPKSIIVIEDIDCSIDLTNRSSDPEKSSPPSESKTSTTREYGWRPSITLSGLLNFTDGLWSCCGNERIFVFTTNHVENIDPALLRCGRMDMHIRMGYCTFPALGILLKNYLGIGHVESDLGDGVMMKELEGVVDLAAMTPAEISEVLIKNRVDRKKAISELLCVLKERVESRHKKNEGVTEVKNSGGGKDVQ